MQKFNPIFPSPNSSQLLLTSLSTQVHALSLSEKQKEDQKKKKNHWNKTKQKDRKRIGSSFCVDLGTRPTLVRHSS